MRFSASLALLCLSAAAKASWLGGGGQSQVALDSNELDVPGENPLTYCTSPDDYLLVIDKVDLDPNPPQA